jgi:hypothetical protein
MNAGMARRATSAEAGEGPIIYWMLDVCSDERRRRFFYWMHGEENGEKKIKEGYFSQ